jgi:hypothetical protein
MATAVLDFVVEPIMKGVSASTTANDDGEEP